VYDRCWKLDRRPYDLSHAAASLWLTAGVPATEVARRLGHSVTVQLRVYANCAGGGEHGLKNESRER
jgi:integrase